MLGWRMIELRSDKIELRQMPEVLVPRGEMAAVMRLYSASWNGQADGASLMAAVVPTTELLKPLTLSGSTDALLYPQAAVVGSAANSPGSRGYLGEIDYLPWLNTKLQLQYVRYTKFNGSTTNYDGTGRNASDNNTLYLLGWINF